MDETRKARTARDMAGPSHEEKLAAAERRAEEAEARLFGLKSLTAGEERIDATLTGEGVKVLAFGLAQYLHDVGAENYVEMHVQTQDGSERFAVTVQRVGKVTPHEARVAVESALASERAARVAAEKRAEEAEEAGRTLVKVNTERFDALLSERAAREKAERERDSVTIDRDSWADQAEQRVSDAAEYLTRAEAAESSLSRAVEALRRIVATVGRDESCGGLDTWGDFHACDEVRPVEDWCGVCIARGVLAEVGAAPEVHVPRAAHVASTVFPVPGYLRVDVTARASGTIRAGVLPQRTVTTPEGGLHFMCPCGEPGPRLGQPDEIEGCE